VSPVLIILNEHQIQDNIGLGGPENAMDTEKIRQAAKLGGAEDFIDRLPGAFETYLERPVHDQSSGLPSGTTTIFGKPVEQGRILSGMDSYNQSLSGGQMQRIAL
jgi:ABC-type multidrug transport system fused ATPase/permease subunit